jgi:hypothetical protein
MAFCTARSEKHVRSLSVASDGQHSPLSFAQSANAISTDFAVGGMQSGQQFAMTARLI